jgi:hypothetical protein
LWGRSMKNTVLAVKPKTEDFYRYEFKYLLNLVQREVVESEIANFMSYDGHAHEELENAYYVCSLHFSVLPRISIQINRLRFYNQGRLLLEFGKNLKLISWNGFHLNDGRVITVSRDFETVNVYVPENKYGKAGRVEVDLSFERLGLASPFPCGSKSNSHAKAN